MPDTLEERVEELGEQVRSLAASQTKEKPWYKTPGTIISLLALSASLVTTIYSSILTNIQEKESIRNQLRATLVQLTDLGVKSIEFQIKHKDTSDLSVGGQYLGAQNTVLAKHAYYLVNKLGQAASSSDLLLVANGMVAIGDSSAAEVLLKRAVERSENITDKLNAGRDLASTLFRLNRSKDAENELRSVITAAAKEANGPNSDYIHSEIAFTYLTWAESIGNRDCSKTSDRLKDSKSYVIRISENNIIHNWFPSRSQVLETWLRTVCKSNEEPAWPAPTSGNILAPTANDAGMSSQGGSLRPTGPTGPISPTGAIQ